MANRIDLLVDVILGGTDASSLGNNMVGLKKSIQCKDSILEVSIKSANVIADMGTISKKYGEILKTGSNILGCVQFGISIYKWARGEAELNSGDVISGVGSILSSFRSLTPFGVVFTAFGFMYNVLDMITKDHTPEYCGLPREDDENPSLKDAKNASSPIILDLNGDGIKTTGIASWRYFDHDQSGFAEMTAWADKNDGILALDLNGNGKIDDGREIFGNNTFLPDGTLAPHGYAALAQYDSNHDGKIDSHDEIWEKLRVWRDKNEDAKTGKNELHTLDELGIAAINLNAEEVSETDEAGNRVTHRATVTKTDGTTMASADVWFNVNTAQTRYLGDETVSEDIAALPNVKGFGNVPSLHVAMNKDSKLKEMVETYLSADSEHRDALLPEIIYKWTGSENVVSNSRGRHIDARTLAALERLTGDTFLQNGRDPNPNPNAARILQDEFDKFSRYTEAKILLQKPEYANARSIMDFLIDRADANDEPVNWDLFAQYLSQVNKAGQTEKVKTEYRLIENFLTYSSKYKDSLRGFFTQHAEDYSEFFLSGIIKSLTGDETNNTLTGSNRPDAILGLAGNDTLEGKAGNDYLNGGAGDDKLTGRAGHDTLDGGSGNDYMEGGGYESDTYLFRAGHGKDTVSDYAIEDKDADTLRFSGAKAADSRYRREGYHLIVNAYGENDAVTLNNYFYADNYQRYNFQFEDAVVQRKDFIAEKTLEVSGTEKNDSLQGWVTKDVIHGGAGNDSISADAGDDLLHGDSGDDVLHGNQGQDTLHGDEGNDRLYGGEGSDILDGGAGNDLLDGGGKERDTYLFRAGHGKDTVSDYAIEDKDADTLRFSGAKAADSRYRREGSHLIVNAYGENDAVTLNNYFYGDNYQRYNFQFDDATFKAAELRGKDLPTEGLKAPVAATAQTTDAAMPDSATAAVTPQENAATATADESKAQAAKASEKIIEVDTFHPPLRLHKDDTASTDAVQKADNATVSGNDAGKNVLAAQTPANIANPSAATNAASAATAPASDKPQTAAVASADSSAASKADTQSATVQQNAESVNAALKTGGAAATPASTLDAKAAQQSQQMLSAMATQGQTATPTALAAPDLQPKPQLVASQV